METKEYQQAQAEGDAAEMGRLIMQAKVQGMNEYNASKGAQLALESELALAAAIRDDARSDQAYWDAGYRKSQEYSKGLAAGMASALVGDRVGDYHRTVRGGAAVRQLAAGRLLRRGRRMAFARRRAGAGALRRYAAPAPRGGSGCSLPGRPGRPTRAAGRR